MSIIFFIYTFSCIIIHLFSFLFCEILKGVNIKKCFESFLIKELLMKKIIAMLLLAGAVIFAAVSCKSAPPPSPEPKPQPVVEKEPEPIAEPEPEPEPEPVVEEPAVSTEVNMTAYIVKNEDTLSQIAEKFYGSRVRGYYFPIIMTCSTGVVKHPDRIYPGMKINIPNFDEFMQNSEYVGKGSAEFDKVINVYRSEGKPDVATFLRNLQEKMKDGNLAKIPR
ncbi:LysM domain protein [Treponema phagedenis F0421]|nr:LysM domain protein [Treponema phagedenis F0421]